MSELFTVKEVARILKCNPETVRRYIKEGLLGASKLTGKLKAEYRITQRDIDNFLKEGRKRG